MADQSLAKHPLILPFLHPNATVWRHSYFSLPLLSQTLPLAVLTASPGRAQGESSEPSLRSSEEIVIAMFPEGVLCRRHGFQCSDQRQGFGGRDWSQGLCSNPCLNPLMIQSQLDSIIGRWQKLAGI